MFTTYFVNFDKRIATIASWSYNLTHVFLDLKACVLSSKAFWVLLRMFGPFSEFTPSLTSNASPLVQRNNMGLSTRNVLKKK